MSVSLQLSLHPRTAIVNRSKLRALLVLACAALCAGLLAACGETDERAASSASSVLEQTLAATSDLDSGRLSGRLRLEPDGLLALGGPIVLTATGPFAAPAAAAGAGPGPGPRFDIALGGAIAGSSLRARASSTGKRAYLRLGDRDYALGGYGSHAHGRRAKARGALGARGLNPVAWVKDPEEHGGAIIDGVETTHVTGDLDVARLLADVAKLLDGGRGGDGLLTPTLRKQIAGAVKTAKVEIWTGVSDRILRRLTAVVDFTFKDASQSPITGLDGGRIDLRLRLDDVDKTTFEVATPQHARPLSALIGDADLGALLSGFGRSLGPRASGGDGGEALLHCIAQAGGDAAKAVRCASRVAP
ncbi:MAG: hypothetical protein QOG56_2355 [Solirubrobacteraceae bacterium]|nr:hypothetical protein [Solirubrobacteraceae bacterium]